MSDLDLQLGAAAVGAAIAGYALPQGDVWAALATAVAVAILLSTSLVVWASLAVSNEVGEAWTECRRMPETATKLTVIAPQSHKYRSGMPALWRRIS